MLTLILLVVLGGGLGILAVSMAERKPATNDLETRRARVPEPEVVSPEPEPEPDAEPEPVAAPAARLEPVRQETVPSGPLKIPAAQTAVEGQLGDLIRPSPARRMMSLAGIAVIVVFVGVAIAALLGAIVGGAAEIVGNAIG